MSGSFNSNSGFDLRPQNASISKPPMTPLTGATRVSTGSPMPSALKSSANSPGGASQGGIGGSPKSVSFVDSPHMSVPTAAAVGPAGMSPFTQESVVSNTDFWDDQSDGHSMSGYSAYSGRRMDSGETLPSSRPQVLSLGTTYDSYRLRLARFYKKYNPEKLLRVDEFLSAYKGDEEVLFRVLVQKYGPEPLPSSIMEEEIAMVSANVKPPTQQSSLDAAATVAAAPSSLPGTVQPVEIGGAGGVAASDARSDCGSVMHYSGGRWELPKQVSAEDGRTDVPTPYWPGNRSISDTDLLSLLKNLRTENEELSRNYMGLLAQHPSSSFNGLVYVTKAPFPAVPVTDFQPPEVIEPSHQGTPPGLATPPPVPPPSTEPFLDHQWAGQLANNKSLVHQNATFSRTVLHCTDECQAGHVRLGSHERWRLTVYWWDGSPLSLFRVMWDPLIAPLPPMDSSASDTASNASSMVPKPVAARKALHGGSRRTEQPVQPVQPPTAAIRSSPDAAVTVELLETKVREMLLAFGKRVEDRILSVEKRLDRLEGAVFPKARK